MNLPVHYQRVGRRCFLWAWQRGNTRPVSVLRFGWCLQLGAWLARDDDENVSVVLSLLWVHWELTLSSDWAPSPALLAWAEEEA